MPSSMDTLTFTVLASDWPPNLIMSNETNGDVSMATEPQTEKPKFSWLRPHPTFVILLVGSDEQPFGIQKDFLCAKSAFYNKQFADQTEETKVEHIVKLPDTTAGVFGLAQNFLYTEQILSTDKDASLPSYESLVGLWNLGHKLEIEGLCQKTLDTMLECRRRTERIPATPLLVKVWHETPEGSAIRDLLLSWTAEYMRSGAAKAEFAKSLPQEVLSELVVAMSLFDARAAEAAQVQAQAQEQFPRKNVHYLDTEGDETLNNTKRNRRSSGYSPAIAARADSISGRVRPPPPKLQKRRSSGFLEGRTFSTAQKMEFCADLLTRMLSGPGFWTRLVGPFRDPVEPDEDGVPDYFKKVKRPMDLMTIKYKMDRKEYATDEDFASDVRQIFENCFLYWKKGDPMWEAGERLQKTFEDKFSYMNKWIAKMGTEED